MSVPFSMFIQSCKSYLSQINAASDSMVDQGILERPTCSREICSSSSGNSEQVYLAQASSLCTTQFRLSCLFGLKNVIYLYQVSIMNTENREKCSLQVLKEDIQEVSINFAF